LWDLALRWGKVISLDVEHYLPGKLMVLGKGKLDRQSLDIGGGLGEALDDWVAFAMVCIFSPNKGCNGFKLASEKDFREF
jgi:hypothetical protein